jgi:Luciferase-like monooxygenase
MKFLVAVRPGLVSPTVSARMAVSLDKMSGGRCLINVVTGGDPTELAGEGLHLDHDARYEVTDEFLTVWKPLVEGRKVDFEGRHLKIIGGRLLIDRECKPKVPLYFGGSSDAAIEVAGPCCPSRPSAQLPNGRGTFANRDFGRELPITFKKVVFSATACECQLLVLKEDDFQRLFKGNPEIKAQIDKESDARFEINRRARDAATD